MQAVHKLLIGFLALLVINCGGGSSTPIPPPPVNLTKQEMEYLNARTIVIGYPAHSRTLAYQGDNGDPAGTSIEMVKLAVKKTGMKVKWVAYPTQAENIEAFKRRETDIVPLAKKVPEREEFMSFTQPYQVVGCVMLIHELPIKFPMRVGYANRFAVQASLEKRAGQLEIVGFKTDEDSFKALLKDEVGAVVLDIQAAEYLEKKYNIRFARSPVDFVYDLSVGYQKDNELLGNIFEKGLAAITPEEKAIALKP